MHHKILHHLLSRIVIMDLFVLVIPANLNRPLIQQIVSIHSNIIDTPFARIDKEHRGKILNQFFKNLNGQIIILSTDEEIVGEYRESVSDIVSNTFVLSHTENGSAEILADTYFGGKRNDQ